MVLAKDLLLTQYQSETVPILSLLQSIIKYWGLTRLTKHTLENKFG